MGVTTEPAAMPEPAPTEGEAAVPVDGGDMSVGGVSTLNSEGQEETWEEEPVGEKVQETVQIRKCIPIKMASTEGKYLDEKVWPTLRPALEKLLLSVQYNTPKEVRQSYPGGMNGDEVLRVTRPQDAEYEPLQWLAQYLENYNPYRPQKYTRDTAALAIQCAWRKILAQRVRTAKAAEHAARISAQALADRQNSAATVIQASWRGYCVRQEISLGLKGAFQLTSQAQG
eukprot:m.449040 g.449040  ORF g.449040 m.449040 type:complete len:228 (+) comp19757_c0_seq1:150-833(+)